ncbi:hypothetical protein TSUD_342130 [Trifolium subterraneum]|nr:hypothetical protein TSUD_342130 [Trifolium subterraneum]
MMSKKVFVTIVGWGLYGVLEVSVIKAPKSAVLAGVQVGAGAGARGMFDWKKWRGKVRKTTPKS